MASPQNASPGRLRAAKHFDFAEPVLEFVSQEAAVFAWRPPRSVQSSSDTLSAAASPNDSVSRSPRPLPGAGFGPLSARSGTMSARTTTASSNDLTGKSPRELPSAGASGPLAGDNVRMLRRYYVEWRVASSPEYAAAETCNCHVVIPIDRWGEPLNLRISFRQAPVVGSLAHAVENLIRSEVYVGDRVVFFLKRASTPHPLAFRLRRSGSRATEAPLASTSTEVNADDTAAATVGAAPDNDDSVSTDDAVPSFMSRTHPLTYLAFAATTSLATSNPLGAVRAALKTLGASEADLLDSVQGLGFDTVAAIKVAAIQIDLTTPAVARWVASGDLLPVVANATRAILLVASPAIDRGSHYNNRAVSPAKDGELNVERELVSSWLTGPETVVVTTGFGAHGSLAAKVGQSLNRLVRNPSKFQASNLLDPSLMSDVARFAASRRLMACVFCAPMERFMDRTKNQPILTSAADAASRCLYILPRSDATWSDPSEGAAAASQQSSPARGNRTGDRSSSSVGGGAAAAAGGPSPATDSSGGPSALQGLDPFERLKSRLPDAPSDLELGVPVDFVVHSITARTGVAVTAGTAPRTAEDDAVDLLVSPSNPALQFGIRHRLLASTCGCTLAEAVEKLEPQIDSVVVRSGRGCDVIFDVRGSNLDGLLAATLAFDAEQLVTSGLSNPGSPYGREPGDAASGGDPVTYDLNLDVARADCERAILPVHLGVLIRFVHHSKAAAGVASVALFVTTTAGIAMRSGVNVHLPPTLTPFLQSNRLAATSRDEPFAETPHDAFIAMLRMEALSLVVPPGAGQERPVKILTAIDRCASAVDATKAKSVGASVKSVFAKLAEKAAAKINNEPLTASSLIAVPAAAADADAVRAELRSLSSATGGGTARIPPPDTVVQKFSGMFKRWITALPFVAAIDTYARKVIELSGMLGLPLTPEDAELVIQTSCYGDESGDVASTQLSLVTVEALLYHHVCSHISAIGVRTVQAHNVLCDQMPLGAFVEGFSRVFLTTPKYAEARASEASALYEDALALYAVCHIFCARVAEQFTRFTAVAGPVGSGVTSVLRVVQGVEEREGAGVTRSILGQTVVREVPFTLPHLLLTMNLFHSVSIVIVLEDADCAANGTVADVLEAIGALCERRAGSTGRRQHVGVFISKLDEYLRRHPTSIANPTATASDSATPAASTGVDGSATDDGVDGDTVLKLTSAAVALEALRRVKSGSPGNPGWDCIAAVAGAVLPRVETPRIKPNVYVDQATAALRCMVLASSI